MRIESICFDDFVPADSSCPTEEKEVTTKFECLEPIHSTNAHLYFTGKVSHLLLPKKVDPLLSKVPVPPPEFLI